MASFKVVINSCYGGFSLSEEALEEYRKRSGRPEIRYSRSIQRNDPLLVQVVEEMREKANGMCASLQIVELPLDASDCWSIHEYDGAESVVYDKNMVNLRRKLAEIIYDDSMPPEKKIEHLQGIVTRL